MINIDDLPEHRRSYGRRDGYVYVLHVSTGIVKAGMTRNPRGRIGTHHRDATKFGATIDRLWLSPMHENYAENETKLLAALGVPEHGNEYFRMEFDAAVSVAEKLEFVILTEEERNYRDARLDAETKARVSRMLPLPPPMPEDYVTVRVPENVGALLVTLFSPDLPREFRQADRDSESDKTELIAKLSRNAGIPVGEIASWSYLHLIEYLAKLAIENQRLDLTLRAHDAGRTDLIEPAYKLGGDRPAGAIYSQDALKYAAAVARKRIEWTTDEIGGSGCDHHGHELPVNAIADLSDEIAALAALFGDINTYSDGRSVETSAWIVADELGTSHVWHPDPAQEESRSWRGNLRSGDPDVPSPGVYEVTTYPATQEIHVRVVRTA